MLIVVKLNLCMQKYSQPPSISRAQQTVATAAFAHGMLGYFIVPVTKQGEAGGGGRWSGLMWQI